MSTSQSTSSEYAAYLTLDEILTAQHPRSDVHDELLFIIAHQVHELWFKELLHELADLQRRLTNGDTIHATQSLLRCISIVEAVISPLDVLDTLAPGEFAAFRRKLGTGSGLQSAQFREIEAVLSRRTREMYERYPVDSEERIRIEAAMRRPSVFDSFLSYLAARGHQVPIDFLHRDVTAPLTVSAELEHFLLDLYVTDSEVAHVCDLLVKLDQRVQDWRYRHVCLVERIIGQKAGTGGSTGTSYLRATLFRPIFPALWAIRGCL
jgi:tryptophan 2,3-dioxygenase